MNHGALGVTGRMISIIQANLTRDDHMAAIVAMTAAYSTTPTAGGERLSDDVLARLPAALRACPGALVLLAYEGDQPVGVATCFVSVSTFAAQPLINVHDLAVVASRQGRGIGRQLLQGVEEIARRRGCCKVTLEVQRLNEPAIKLYESLGFGPSVTRDAPFGEQLFFVKLLS